ncbi:hypothetical protein [Dyadobacter sp. CY356]|uniref:hypothetical protein n=1 Tax=Dyadobacter sp. CY356 TaxID=2906442 RepID=UPI001F167F4E|nr:hypothetical protein [Dyadobacter sp. CY356]MCF0055517.1 hypothetical protein [Dyadobacter sp. CY356]
MSFYSEMADMAKEAIAENGRPVILRRNTEGSYNPATDTFTGTGNVDENPSALFTEYKQAEIDGTVIIRGDKKVLLADAALTAPPEYNDIIVDGSDEYKVINIFTVKPGDTSIIYKLQVRK